MPLDERFFAPDKIEERTVELGDGSKEVLYFKHLPNTAFERFAIWSGSADEEVQASASARLVALGLCEPDGTPALTQEQAYRLKRQVLVRIYTTLLEVNGFGAKQKAEAGNP